MIRSLLSFGAIAVALAVAGAPIAPARTRTPPKEKADPKPPGGDPANKPLLVGTYGDWSAYQAQVGKNKLCYALAKPKDRQPANLTRDPAYVFIATRPSEGVRNEISVIMGFPLKEGTIEGGAGIGDSKFDLVAKGEDAWVKNAAQEAEVIDALRRGSRLIVKAASKRGHVTIDTYALSGLSQALDKVAKECP